MELKLGQHITVILYRGPSKVEAECLYGSLMDFYNRKEPMLMAGTEFYILIEGAKKEEFDDSPIPCNTHIMYQVTLKGELVDGKAHKS